MPPKVLRFAIIAVFVFALIHSAQVSREATLSVRIVDDATGQPTPVRVRLTDANGNGPHVRGALAVSDSAIPLPRQAIALMWGQQDRAQGFADQPDGSFYVDGAFDVRLPAGPYRLAISKGFEYLKQTATIELAPSANVAREFRMKRWIDMPARGWYSSDDHIHLRRSPADDASIARWIAAEDIQVGNLLQMGDFWAVYFYQYAFGEAGRYQEAGRILSPGQEEPRTPEIGHTISLGANDFVRNTRDYYSFDKLFDRVHELGGVTGFAHQGMSFSGYRGMALNTIRGKTDFLELAQFCVPEGPLPLDHYYEFLNLGYRLTALAGSDFPWCGLGPAYGFPGPSVAQIGNARFYTYVGGPLTFGAWFSALRAGHTVVSTGPMLFLKVNGKIPGDTLDVAPGAKLTIEAEAFGESAQEPLESIEIVAHGKVVAASRGTKAGHLTARFEVTAEHGVWIAAKCSAGKAQVAHTTPVYVTVNGGGFHDPAAAPELRRTMERYLHEIEEYLANPGTNLDVQAPRHRAELERQIAEARAKLKSLRLD